MVQLQAGRFLFEVIGAVVPEIVFRGAEVGPIGGDFWPPGINLSQSLRDRIPSGIGEELPDDHFRPLVVALAESMVANATLGVDEVERWPVIVGERTPYGVVAVDGDRVLDPHFLCGAPDVVEVLLKLELRRVRTDHDQPLILVPLGPGADIRKRPQPVDARVGPELHQDDAPTQTVWREWP